LSLSVVAGVTLASLGPTAARDQWIWPSRADATFWLVVPALLFLAAFVIAPAPRRRNEVRG